MTLNSVSSCIVFPQNEFINVLATQMNGQKTLNTVSSCMVSPQNEFLMYLQPKWHSKRLRTLWPAVRFLPQNEFLNVLATQINGRMGKRLLTLGAAVRFLPEWICKCAYNADPRKFFFTERAVDKWNGLPETARQANKSKAFKGSLKPRHWEER